MPNPTYKYIGWIPCLSGELFFSKTRPSLGSYDIVHSNLTSRSLEDNTFLGRHLFTSSVVDWQDTEFIAKPNGGLYRVVVIAKTNSYKALAGFVYLIEKNRLDRSEFRFLPREDHELEIEIMSELGLVSNSKSHYEQDSIFGSSESLDQHYDNIKNKFSKMRPELGRELEEEVELSEAGVHSGPRDIPFVHICKFYIDKSGVILLHPVAAVDIATGKRSCMLSFYYLKFLLHRHSHHASDNESLTTLHQLKPSGVENAEILLRDIKRGLVDARRSRGRSRQLAAGIALYGDSLIQSCESLGWYDKEKEFTFPLEGSEISAKTQQRYLSNIQHSLSLLQKNVRSGKRSKNNFLNEYQKWLVTTVGVLAPILIFVNAHREKVRENLAQFDSSKECPNFVAICDSMAARLSEIANGTFYSFLNSYLLVIIFIPTLLTLFSLRNSDLPYLPVVKRAGAFFTMRAGVHGKKGADKYFGKLFLGVAFLTIQIKRIEIFAYRPSTKIIVGTTIKRTLACLFGILSVELFFEIFQRLFL